MGAFHYARNALCKGLRGEAHLIKRIAYDILLLSLLSIFEYNALISTKGTLEDEFVGNSLSSKQNLIRDL